MTETSLEDATPEETVDMKRKTMTNIYAYELLRCVQQVAFSAVIILAGVMAEFILMALMDQTNDPLVVEKYFVFMVVIAVTTTLLVIPLFMGIHDLLKEIMRQVHSPIHALAKVEKPKLEDAS